MRLSAWLPGALLRPGVAMLCLISTAAFAGAAAVRETYVQSEGARLKTFVYGSGARTVILVHGGPGLPGYMRTLGERLQGEFRIVEFLQRDAAASESKGPFTIEAKAMDLAVVVRSFSDHGPPVIVAHSGGTLATLEFAKRALAPVGKIILIAAAGLVPETDQKYDRNLTERMSALVPGWSGRVAAAEKAYKNARGTSQRRVRYHRMLDLYWPAYFPDGKKPAALTFLPANLDASSETEADYSRAMKEGVFLKDLDRIRVPVVHFHGDRDPLPWEDTSRRLRSAVRDYRLVIVKGAGHFPWLDDATSSDFVRALADAVGR